MSGRRQYIAELMKHVEVDSYGTCMHNRDLPFREGWFQNSDRYTKFLAGYKFFIGSPNCVCDDYVDDNLWFGMRRGNVVIWTGDATRGNIDDWVPTETKKGARKGNGVLSVLDFDSPKALAEHVKYLDGNDTAYEELLAWKWKARQAQQPYPQGPHQQPAKADADTLHVNPALLRRWEQSQADVGGCDLCNALLKVKQIDPTGHGHTMGKLPGSSSIMGASNVSCAKRGIAEKWGERADNTRLAAKLFADMDRLPAEIWAWRRGAEGGQTPSEATWNRRSVQEG